jgi:hypothetical protein
MYGFGQAGYSTGGVVTVSGYQVGDTSNYNLNQDQLEAAFQQMFPINAPTASDTTEENITQAQLTAAITPTASSFLSGSTQIGNTQVSNTTLATVGLLFIAVLVGVAIVK